MKPKSKTFVRHHKKRKKKHAKSLRNVEKALTELEYMMEFPIIRGLPSDKIRKLL